MSAPSVMFVAGDPSGDEHASHILPKLRELVPNCRCFGIGGPAMTAYGFESLLPFEEFNRMGLIEVLTHLPFFLKAKKRLIAALDIEKPKVLVCVDYPGLNFQLMEAAKARNIPVVWYIVPQVWAWKKKRAAILGNQASFIGTVFPFEVDYFKQYPAPVAFVGHPLVEALEKRQVLHAPARLAFDKSSSFRIALIPGSRKQEIVHILPEMVKAAILLKKKYPHIQLTVSRCRHFSEEMFKKMCRGADIEITTGSLSDLLSKTDMALVTSGTATLETALAQIPLVIAYRASSFNYALMKNMVTVPFIGLPNIVANEKIVPECIQGEASAKNMASEIEKYIVSREHYDSTVDKLSQLKNMLGSKKPSEEIANAISSFITC